jgi:uncharacterized membrane protein
MILLLPLLIAWFIEKITGRRNIVIWGGLTGLSVSFIFFGIGHFIKTQGMIAMLPPFLPERELLVYATGGLEIILGICIWIPAFRKVVVHTQFILLILFFPANVYAAFNYVEFGGHAWGPVYLIIRVPLQALLLFWVWKFGIQIARSPLRASAKC